MSEASEWVLAWPKPVCHTPVPSHTRGNGRMTLCVGFVVQEGLLEVNAAVLVASLRSFYGASLELVVRARPHRRTCGAATSTVQVRSGWDGCAGTGVLFSEPPPFTHEMSEHIERATLSHTTQMPTLTISPHPSSCGIEDHCTGAKCLISATGTGSGCANQQAMPSHVYMISNAIPR
jgi:hypothetical protein